MKSLIKAYTLPLVVLVVGGGAYYLAFSKSVDFHVNAKNPTALAQAPTDPDSGQAGAAITPTATTLIDSENGKNSADGEADSGLDSPAYIAQASQSSDPQIPSAKDLATPEAPAPNPQDPSTAQPFAQTPSQAPQAQVPQTLGEPQDTQNTQDPKIEAMYYAKVANLNIRALPKSSGRILGKLAMGQGVNVIEIQDDWAKLDSGGWVSLSLLTPTQPSQRPYIVLAKTLNIRALPESGSLVIGALYKDQRVQVAEIQDDWAKLDSGGWVSLRLIKAL